MASPDYHHEDGFDFTLLPAKTGKAARLIVVMHGHGSNPENWEPHARQLHDAIPDADIINLRGPLKTAPKPGEPQGYTWVPHEGKLLAQGKAYLSMIFNHLPIVDDLNHYLDQQLKKRDLKDENLGILGNSMGCITALQTTLYREHPVGGVVGHSGALLPFTKGKTKPEVLLIMGGKDEIFCRPDEPPKKGLLSRTFNKVANRFAIQHKDTKRRMEKKGIPFEEKFYPDLAHESNAQTITDSAIFLNKKIKSKHHPDI